MDQDLKKVASEIAQAIGKNMVSANVGICDDMIILEVTNSSGGPEWSVKLRVDGAYALGALIAHKAAELERKLIKEGKWPPKNR